MKIITILTTTFLLTGAASASAENMSHTHQLLSTKTCLQCDLSGAGLVQNDLTGAKLNRANLIGSNLNRANLAGADLRGANMMGASLNGANLRGADLRGANLTGTDLRSADLVNANLQGVDVRTASLEGAVGISTSLGTAEDFYRRGFLEWQKNDFTSAIEHYDRAIALKPKFSGAYLARSLAKFHLPYENDAVKDAMAAEHLFFARKDREGVKIAQLLIKKIKLAKQPTANPAAGNSNFDDLTIRLNSMLLNFF